MRKPVPLPQNMCEVLKQECGSGPSREIAKRIFAALRRGDRSSGGEPGPGVGRLRPEGEAGLREEMLRIHPEPPRIPMFSSSHATLADPGTPPPKTVSAASLRRAMRVDVSQAKTRAPADS